MDMLAVLRKLFEYDDWGNREVLTSLSFLLGGKERPLQLFAHVVNAERMWLARLRQEDTTAIPVWSSGTPEDCRGLAEEMNRQWKKYLDGLTSAKLARKVAYRNTQGVPYETPIGDILTHVILHSAYHRGQVAAAVRGAGGTPAGSDYIAYVRSLPQEIRGG